MRHRPGLFGTAIFLASFIASGSNSRADDWVELRSAHFTVTTDAGEGRAKNALEDLEDLRRLITQMLPSQPVESSVPVSIVLFKNDRSMQDFQPQRNGRAEEWAALFRTTGLKKYLLIQSLGKRDASRELVYGQFLTLIQSYNSVRVPIWFSNGLSLFYSNAEIRDDSANIGKMHRRHQRELGEFKSLPVSELFEVDTRSQQYRDPNQRPLFDAQCWALMHFILIGQGTEGVGSASRFLELLSEGVEPPAALERALGRSLADIDQLAYTYVRKRISQYVRFGLTETGDDQDYEARKLTDDEATALKGELFFAVGKTEAARITLEGVAEKNPDLTSAFESLGALHLETNDVATAAGLFRRAVELGSDNPRVHEKFALALLQDYFQGGHQTIPADVLEPALSSLRAALRLAPDSADAARALGFVSLFDGGDPSEGITTIDRALSHHPGDARLLFVLAQLYVNQSAYVDAKSILDNLNQRTLPPDLTGPVQNLTRVNNQRIAAGTPPTRPTGDAAPVEAQERMTGTLVRLDCERAGSSYFVVESEGEIVALRVLDPTKVPMLEGGELVSDKRFRCGPQEPTEVTVTLTPLDEDDGSGEKFGILHQIEFP